MIADRLRGLWWQRPPSGRREAPLKGLSDNPAYQWWRDPVTIQPDSWWGKAATPESLEVEAATMEELGVNVFRFDVPWREVAPERPGKAGYQRATAADPDWSGYRWERLDRILETLLKGAITPVPVISHAPAWATEARGTSPASPPEQPEFFADLMAALAARYRGRVLHWELWNEPDHPHSWTGTLADYVDLVLEPGSVAVRSQAPECAVLLGGLASEHSLEAIHRAGGGPLYDIASVHSYPPVASVRSVRRAVSRVRWVLEKEGCRSRPVWLTECGINTAAPSPPSDFGGITDEPGQARFIQALYESVAADAIFLYQMRDTAIFDGPGALLKRVYWGLLGDQARRKPGFEAYRAALTGRNSDPPPGSVPKTLAGPRARH